MSIVNPNYRNKAQGNGVNNTFAYGVKITSKTDLTVVHTDINGLDATLVVDNDYTVNGVGSDTSANWNITYPVSGTILPTGEYLTIILNIPATQETDFDNQGNNFSKATEDACDKLTKAVGQLQEALNRTIQVAISSDNVPAASTLLATITAAAASCAASQTASASSATSAAASAASVNLRTINSQSSGYTVVAGDRNKLIKYTGTGSTIALTAAATLGSGFEFEITHQGSGNLVIDPNASETIDGHATITLTADQSITVVCDGSNFLVTQALGYGAGAGSVTSVAASGGVETVSGSAITGAGTVRGGEIVNSQTGTTYTYVDGDRGKLVTHKNASAMAGTLPQAGASSSFVANWYMDVQNRGAGTLTITPTTSLIDSASTLVLTSGQGCRIVSNGTDYFTLRGVSAAAASSWSTGDAKLTYKTTPDSGWVMADDGTIGDGSSGGTNRANADTSDLFTLLWNNCANGVAPVSGGRGANAAADFAAHKTLTLCKTLSRSLGIAGAGSGLTTRALGDTVGSETHTLTTSEMPSHTHAFSSTATNYPSSGTLPAVGNNGAGAAITTDSAGSGTAHSILQPTGFINLMIKL